jgi:hypothetical protein
MAALFVSVDACTRHRLHLVLDKLGLTAVTVEAVYVCWLPVAFERSVCSLEHGVDVPL